MIAGNHDHYGNVSAELEYSLHSERWNFPSTYYKKSFISDDHVSLDVLFIDTVDLSGSNGIMDDKDPKYYEKLAYKLRDAADEQWAWISAELAASTADHVIVAGHYPVYSVCKHGNTQNLLDLLKPLLTQYGAHYFSGHDHCM